MAEFEDDYEEVDAEGEEAVELEDHQDQDVDAAEVGEESDEDDAAVDGFEEAPEEVEAGTLKGGLKEPPVAKPQRRHRQQKAAEDDVPEPEEAQPQVVQPQRDDAAWNRLAWQNRQLERRFEMLVDTLAQAAQQPQAPPEPEPDPEEDLPGFLVHSVKQLREDREQEKAAAQQRAQLEAHQAELRTASMAAAAFRDSLPDPQVYGSAVDYLTRVSFEELAEELPHLAPEEVGQLLYQQAEARVLGWTRQGKNPGAELMKLAQRRGWRVPEKPPAAPRVEQPKADPKKEVQAQRQREQKARTISSVGGASAAPVTHRRLLSLSEDDYEREIKSLASKAGRPLGLADLLKHKAKR